MKKSFLLSELQESISNIKEKWLSVLQGVGADMYSTQMRARAQCTKAEELCLAVPIKVVLVPYGH